MFWLNKLSEMLPWPKASNSTQSNDASQVEVKSNADKSVTEKKIKKAFRVVNKGNQSSDETGILQKATAGLSDALSATTAVTQKVAQAVGQGLTKAPGFFSELTKEALQKVAHYETSIEKEEVRSKLALYEQEMRGAQGEQFVKLYAFIRTALHPKFVEMLEAQSEYVQPEIIPNLLKLIDLLLARGFANLAKGIAQNQDQIPHYRDQPALVNALSFLCQQVERENIAEELQNLDGQLLAANESVEVALRQLFPLAYEDPTGEQLKLIYQNIRGYIGAKNDREEMVCINELFIKDRQVDEFYHLNEDERHLVVKLEELRKLENKHQEVFQKIADAIIRGMFPEKTADLKDITQNARLLGMGNYLLGNWGYQALTAVCANLLKESYDAAITNPKWNAELEEQVKRVVGGADVVPLLKSSSVVLLNVVKKWMQSSAGAVSFAGDVLASQRVNQAGSAEDARRLQLMHKLSAEPVTDTIVASIQALLRSDDPHLISLGNFLRSIFDGLVLSVLAKGAANLFQEGDKTDPNNFLQECSERLIKKFQYLKDPSLKDDENVKRVVEGFIQDLPLPPALQQMLLPLLVDKMKETIKKIDEQYKAIEEIKKEDEQTQLEMKRYPFGEGLLGAIDSMTVQIVETLPFDPEDIVHSFALDDAMKQISDEYLSGVTVDEDLKKWLIANMKTLNKHQDNVKILIKQVVEIVFRKVILGVINKNFAQDGGAQLLENIYTVFATVFERVDTPEKRRIEKQKIERVIVLKKDLLEFEKQSKELKKELEQKFTQLNPQQRKLYDRQQELHLVCEQAEEAVYELQDQLRKNLEKLNEQQLTGDSKWKQEDFERVRKVILFHQKDYSAADVTYNREIIEKEIQALNAIKSKSGLTTEAMGNLDQLQLLLTLFNMPLDTFKLLTGTLEIDVALKHAKGELESAKNNILQLSYIPILHDVVDAIETRKRIIALKRTIRDTDREIDAQLDLFRALAKECMAFLDLDRKEQIALPPALRDLIWPYVEMAHKQQLARALFDQASPILLAVYDKEENQKKLTELSRGSQFLSSLIHVTSKEVVDNVSRLATSFKPYAKEILAIYDDNELSPDNIDRMERALNQRLLLLGKNKITESMLAPVINDFSLLETSNEKVIKGVLLDLIKKSKDEIRQEDVASWLKAHVNSLDEGRNEELARRLMIRINRLLMDRGRDVLEPKDICEAHENFVAELNVNERLSDREEDTLSESSGSSSLIPDGLIEVANKIKVAVITPEELAETIVDSSIPNAKELQGYVGNQIQSVIETKGEKYKKSVSILGDFVEGAILRLFVRIGEKHSVTSTERDVVRSAIFETITKELKALAAQGVVKQPNETVEDVAQRLINQVVKEVLTIHAGDDLKSIPPALQKLVYKKMHDLAYLYLTPVIIPIIERKELRRQLDVKSGSPFLSQFCQMLSRDIFAQLPSLVNRYHSIAEKMLVTLAQGTDTPLPTQAQIDAFSKTIAKLTKDKQLKNKTLVDAYKQITGSKKDPVLLKERIKSLHAKEEIKKILFTPEAIVESIRELKVLNLDEDVANVMVQELQRFLHEGQERDGSLAYHNASVFIGTYIEGVLLKLFMGIADKNPPVDEKDTVVILVENLLKTVSEEYAKSRVPESKIRRAQSLMTPERLPLPSKLETIKKAVMKKVLGFDSPAALAGVPGILQAPVYALLNEKLDGLLVDVEAGLKTLHESDLGVKKAKEDSKKYGVQENTGKALIQVLAEDVADMTIRNVVNNLAGVRDDEEKEMYGVVVTSKGIQRYMTGLSETLRIARVMLKYEGSVDLQDILQEQLENIEDPEKLIAEKKVVTDAVSNFLTKTINGVMERTVAFEERYGAPATQKMMVGILGLAAKHMEVLNQAKEKALREGREAAVSHADFLAGVEAVSHEDEAKIEKVKQEIQKLSEELSQTNSKDIEAKLNRAQEVLSQLEAHQARVHAAMPKTHLTYHRSVEWIMRSLGEENYLTAKNQTEIEKLREKQGEMESDFAGKTAGMSVEQNAMITKFVKNAFEIEENERDVELLRKNITDFEIKLKTERYKKPFRMKLKREQERLKRAEADKLALDNEKMHLLRSMRNSLSLDNALRNEVCETAIAIAKTKRDIEEIDVSAKNNYKAHRAKLLAAVQGWVAQAGYNERKGFKAIDLDDLIELLGPLYRYCDPLKDLPGHLSADLSDKQKQALKRQEKQSGMTLLELIRSEGVFHEEQSADQFYKTAAKDLLRLIFPGHEKDLTLLPEEMRKPVWGMLKSSAMPALLPIITDSLLNPTMINTIVRSSLENIRDNLNGEIVLTPPDSEDLPYNGLDLVAGELVVQALKAGEVPAWIKKFMVDPKTGETTEAMKRSIGASLRKQFNATFIKEKLQTAIASSVVRDQKGDPTLRFTPALSQEEKEIANEKMRADIKRVSREVVDASISYAIRSAWKSAQASFDSAVNRIFGRVGLKMKQALDLVFRAIFFKIVGNILLFIFNRGWLKERIYSFIDLDETRDRLLSLFTSIPEDSPVEGSPYAIYHQNLVFQVANVMQSVVHEFCDSEPLTPSNFSLNSDARELFPTTETEDDSFGD